MQLGWVDFTQEERKRITAIIKKLHGKTAVDEIGIGTIRDAFSDILFPGSSTVQTRAKYFVLIPRIFQLAEEESFPNKRAVAAWIRKKEDEIALKMTQNSKKNSTGIIGSLGHGNLRKPSEIYWNGLKEWGILIDETCSLSDVCDSVYEKSRTKHGYEQRRGKRYQTLDDNDYKNSVKELFVPMVGRGVYDLSQIKIELTRGEANYLYDRVVKSANEKMKGSLTRFLLLHPKIIMQAKMFADIKINEMPKELAHVTSLAQEFSDFSYGAHLLYNLEYAKQGTGVVPEKVCTELKRWKSRWIGKTVRIGDICDFAREKKADEKAITFIRDFYKHTRKKKLNEAKELVIEREKSIKHSRAKIGSDTKYKEVHMFPTQYRYASTRRILIDIIRGRRSHEEVVF